MKNNNNKIKSTILNVLCPLTFSLLANNYAYSHGLLKVYQIAAKKDPQLQQAFANFKSVEQNVPIAVASLLPEVTLNAGMLYDKVLNFSINNQSNPEIEQRFFSVNFTQPIFYWDRIHRYLQSQVEVEKAIHDLEIAKEDLLLRVSEAYFNVLEAEDNLDFVSTERNSVTQLYKEAKERFDVGLIPVADVDEAQARLDLTIADEIQAKNDVQNRYDELIEIVGQKVDHANILTPNFKPSTPKPVDVKKWLQMAMSRNHTLTSQKLNKDIVEKNEDIAFAGHMPSGDLTASYRGVDSSESLQLDDISSAQGYINSIGASIEGNLEIFGGGGTQAAVEQAEYNTKAENYVTERVRRETVSNTKQAYRNVITNVKQISALEQAVTSGLSALEATKAGYDVGTRASIDVLDRLTELYEQKQRLSQSRYEYIRNVLELKRLAGVLTNKDILTIDKWLINRTNKSKAFDKADIRTSVLNDIKKKDQEQFGTTETKKKLPTEKPVKTETTVPATVKTLPSETKPDPKIETKDPVSKDPVVKEKSIVDKVKETTDDITKQINEPKTNQADSSKQDESVDTEKQESTSPIEQLKNKLNELEQKSTQNAPKTEQLDKPITVEEKTEIESQPQQQQQQQQPSIPSTDEPVTTTEQEAPLVAPKASEPVTTTEQEAPLVAPKASEPEVSEPKITEQPSTPKLPAQLLPPKAPNEAPRVTEQAPVIKNKAADSKIKTTNPENNNSNSQKNEALRKLEKELQRIIEEGNLQ